ncbi:hypothetical protein H8S33_05850 [Ornithinibacillus sp. BX22]|uniref:Uncharacterized protein n=1 Tax=Ornithinibacillus hominis TaxID=2763055 RepID=A0A923RH52_9BACI|nr:hypothetical protein [Ornithinibacillus hominis]MBC5636351.1 hypothetical protein [Ornithinibacillus hominis]
MSKSYTREDVQSLLNQLKKYRKVIREYQENDLEYCQIKSEMKKVKSRLAETRKRLIHMEGKYKDCLFDYYKIKEDKESLLQDLNKLKKELNPTKMIEKTEKNNPIAESLPDKKEQKREKAPLHANEISTDNKKSTASVRKYSPIMKDLDKKEHQKEMMQFNISILNRLFIEREEFKDIMSIYKDNNMDEGTSKSDRESIEKQNVESTVIKGAEPANDNEQGSDLWAKGTEKETVDVSHVNTTLTNLQSQIMEIKKILEERKPPKETRPFPSTTSPTPTPISNPPKKEITFRDLRGLTNIESIPGKIPENKTSLHKNSSTNFNQHTPSSKQKAKPVYVRNIEIKENKKLKNNDNKEEGQVEKENPVVQVEKLPEQQEKPVENVVEITSTAPSERVNEEEYVQHSKIGKMTEQPRQEETESQDREQLNQIGNKKLSTPQVDEESPVLGKPDTVMEESEKEETESKNGDHFDQIANQDLSIPQADEESPILGKPDTVMEENEKEETGSKNGEQLNQVANQDLSIPQADEESPVLGTPDTVMEESEKEETESKNGEQLNQAANQNLSTPQVDEGSPVLGTPDTVMEENEKEEIVDVEPDYVNPNEKTELVQKEAVVENTQEEPLREDKFTLKSFWKKLKKFYG